VSHLREHLAEEIARKVQAHGVVVWDDPQAEYSEVAALVAPDDARFEAFTGSWFDLRKRVEDAIAGEEPPRLLIYGPGSPSDDPMAEVRAAGTVFTRRLGTLVRQALRGELTDARIDEIAGQARTITEAEAAIAGNGEADVRLITVLGQRDVARMLIEILAGRKDAEIGAQGMWPAIAEMCHQSTGAVVQGAGDAVRDGLFRHLLLCDIAAACSGHLDDDLATAWHHPTRAQQDTAVDVLERLRSAADGGATYRALAERADQAMSLERVLTWHAGLDHATGTQAADTVVFRHAISLLQDGGLEDAQSVAEQRLARSIWAADPATGWGARWRAVTAIARLRAEIARTPVPDDGAGMLTWYTTVGYRVDNAHRKLELARTELGVFGDLEQSLTEARTAYDSWLDGLLNRFTSALETGALDPGNMLRQGEVHDKFVGPAGPRTAYVWVDALRYELGVDLAEALRTVAADVALHPAVAAAPTITPVGMAALLPGASSLLKVGLAGEKITVWIGGNEVKDVAGRRSLLRAAHGSVADFDLNDAAQKGERALRRAVGDAALVLVRSQEVDAAGESGMLSAAWSHFETVTNLLASVIARLAQSGIEHVVISADHGFIALGQDIGAPRIVDPPAGAHGTTKRRVFVGRGGIPAASTVRIPLAACGVTSDLDLVVPRGLAVFRSGGGRQFFHGGLSPQELIVPVIVLTLAKTPAPQKLSVGIQVAGGRITTGVFAATLEFSGDMFTSDVTVRVVAAGSEGAPVARIVSGDGYDPGHGTVSVANDRGSVLTFQVTANLPAGGELELQVLDARTGVKLGISTVPVASPVVVEDALD
jgi:hypothetical protein